MEITSNVWFYNDKYKYVGLESASNSTSTSNEEKPTICFIATRDLNNKNQNYFHDIYTYEDSQFE